MLCAAKRAHRRDPPGVLGRARPRDRTSSSSGRRSRRDSSRSATGAPRRGSRRRRSSSRSRRPASPSRSSAGTAARTSGRASCRFARAAPWSSTRARLGARRRRAGRRERRLPRAPHRVAVVGGRRHDERRPGALLEPRQRRARLAVLERAQRVGRRTAAARRARVRSPPTSASVGFPGGERLDFAQEAERARDDDLVLFASQYAQPFGTFTGTLPGGLDVAQGFGVMERHDVRW